MSKIPARRGLRLCKKRAGDHFVSGPVKELLYRFQPACAESSRPLASPAQIAGLSGKAETSREWDQTFLKKLQGWPRRFIPRVRLQARHRSGFVVRPQPIPRQNRIYP